MIIIICNWIIKEGWLSFRCLLKHWWEMIRINSRWEKYRTKGHTFDWELSNAVPWAAAFRSWGASACPSGRRCSPGLGPQRWRILVETFLRIQLCLFNCLWASIFKLGCHGYQLDGWSEMFIIRLMLDLYFS